MKKLVNNPALAVTEMVEGLLLISPDLKRIGHHNAVARSDLSAMKTVGQVAVISGGGAGHEPAHAGFVGPGLLTAAVIGDVFTSPPVDAVVDTIMCCTGAGGALLIVKNYTGDRLNFGLAAEIVRSRGLRVEILLVADDTAWETPPLDGARGLAGTMLVHKVAGASSAAGATLDDVYKEARIAAESLATYGVALSACTYPGGVHPSFELGLNELAMGVGIHGERGVQLTGWCAVDEIMQTVVDRLSRRVQLNPGCHVGVLVNGLGSTSTMELTIVARAANRELRSRGVRVDRIWVGDYVTALDMAGFSISAMSLNDSRLRLLDAPATSNAWTPGRRPKLNVGAWPCLDSPKKVAAKRTAVPDPAVEAVVAGIGNALAGAETILAELDRLGGDGDLGRTMAQFGIQLRDQASDLAHFCPADLLRHMSQRARESLGGTSGPLYAAALLKASSALDQGDWHSLATWVDALDAAISGISELGGAKAGDRTMIDALAPAVARLRSTLARGAPVAAAVREMAEAADAGAAETAKMIARRGRASQLTDLVLGVPDAGAMAVALWLAALADAIGSEEKR